MADDGGSTLVETIIKAVEGNLRGRDGEDGDDDDDGGGGHRKSSRPTSSASRRATAGISLGAKGTKSVKFAAAAEKMASVSGRMKGKASTRQLRRGTSKGTFKLGLYYIKWVYKGESFDSTHLTGLSHSLDQDYHNSYRLN